MKRTYIFITIFGLVIVAVGGVVIWKMQQTDRSPQISTTESSSPSTSPTPTTTPSQSPSPVATATPTSGLREPIAEFKARITKKPFGVYSTPQSSPIPNERFTGYHTGVDVEYEDVQGDVPVMAIADGTVVVSKTATGYGGVIAIQHEINGQTVVAIYGHVRLSSAPKNGTHVQAGDKIGVLGTGYSSETDGERKHLHFDIHKGSGTNIKGYVQTKSELDAWIDPLSLY